MRRMTAALAAAMTAAMTAALVLGSGIATATASPARSRPAVSWAVSSVVSSVVKERGVAGYHFSAGRHVGALTVSSAVTVPKASCGSGVFSPVVSEQYFVGKSETTASVALALGCFGPLPVYGDAVLTIGKKVKNVLHPLKPGAVVTLTVTVRGSAATVKIAYSKKSGVSFKSAGGRPAEAQFVLALPDPPGYSPVRFSDCTVNGKRLAAYHPGAWESVNRSGKPDGKVSGLSKGKNFTVSQ